MLNTRSAMIHLQRTVVVVLHNVARRIFRIGGCLPHVLLGHMLASSLAVTVVHQLFATVSAIPAWFLFDSKHNIAVKTVNCYLHALAYQPAFGFSASQEVLCELLLLVLRNQLSKLHLRARLEAGADLSPDKLVKDHRGRDRSEERRVGK